MADRSTHYMPIDQVPAALRNAKQHRLPEIAHAIRTWGYTSPAVLDERTGRLVIGHGRLEALRRMRDQGETPPDGVALDGDTWTAPVVRGWSSRSDADAEALADADNHLTELGGWDDHMRADILTDVARASTELLEAAGHTQAELDNLLASLDNPNSDGNGDGDGEGGEGDRSELLALSGVTVGEPEHTAETGQLWALDGHRLAVTDLFTGWPAWAPLLDGDDVVFMPYPTLLAPFAKKAQERRLVMVQPEKYLAGHLLDKWHNITGTAPQLVEGNQ